MSYILNKNQVKLHSSGIIKACTFMNLMSDIFPVILRVCKATVFITIMIAIGWHVCL